SHPLALGRGDRTASPTKLLPDGRTIKVHFLADQVVAIEDKNQDTLNLHCLARWRKIGKRATLCTAPLALDNDGVICMVERERFEPEVWERTKQSIEELFYRFRAIGNH